MKTTIEQARYWARSATVHRNYAKKYLDIIKGVNNTTNANLKPLLLASYAKAIKSARERESFARQLYKEAKKQNEHSTM